MARRPDILVVVFDALRGSDFPGGSEEVGAMPFSRALRRECYWFPDAIASGSWTLPSHASLFTGLYPWEHGLHGKGALRLAPTVPTLSTWLREAGYRTGLFSSNGFLAPAYGLTQGFDRAAWGAWWERNLRWPSERPPYQMDGEAPGGPGGPKGPGGGPPEATGWAANMAGFRERHAEWFGSIPNYLDRFPWLIDLAGRLALRIRRPRSTRDVRISPWVEPALNRWVRSLPAEEPYFAVLNIQDTHDPYLPDADEARDLRSWWRLVGTRQDLLGALTGRWRPSSGELRVLRELYRSAVRRLDRRLARIVQDLQRMGRWDRTCLVLTSDHGQAFGEEGRYFHFFGLSEAGLRIPIWVRPPGGTGEGRRGRGLANLVDVVPTVLREAGLAPPGERSGTDLEALRDHPREGPTFAVDDGLVWPHFLRWAAPPDRQRFDRASVAAYQDGRRAIAEEGRGCFELADVGAPPGTPRRLALGPNGRGGSLGGEAEARLALLLRPGRSAPGEVDRRLKDWGYV